MATKRAVHLCVLLLLVGTLSLTAAHGAVKPRPVAVQNNATRLIPAKGVAPPRPRGSKVEVTPETPIGRIFYTGTTVVAPKGSTIVAASFGSWHDIFQTVSIVYTLRKTSNRATRTVTRYWDVPLDATFNRVAWTREAGKSVVAFYYYFD